MSKLWVEGGGRAGLVVVVCVGLASAFGCAVGAEGTANTGQGLGGDPPPSRGPTMPAQAGAGVAAGAAGLGGSSGAGGNGGTSGASGAAGASGAGGMGGAGEACERGSTAPCTCSDGTSEGEKSCQFDASSPTMGSFGACKQCPAPMPGSGAAGGRGGAGGSGAGGSGAAGSGAAGSGGAGSGGAGGGGAGSGGAVMCGMTTCPAAAAPEMACCNLLGACGMTVLGICL